MNCNSRGCLCVGAHEKWCKYDTWEADEETEAEKFLRQMLNRQLDTDISLKQQFERHKSFTIGETEVPLSKAGTSTLHDFVSADNFKKNVQHLLSCGLTENEVDFYMKHTGNLENMKMHTRMEPSALMEKLDEIQEKVRHHKALESEGLGTTQLEANDNAKKPQESRDLKLPTDPLSHILDFSKSLMERVNSRKRKKKENKRGDKGTETEETEVVVEPVDPMRLHTVVPLPEQEILANRLRNGEICSLPRFRDYSPGEKTNVLYLKNLHPKTDVRELMALFLRFDEDDAVVKYRLLSGRLSGQAFVTFPSAESAEKALTLCNGYLLRGKPIIIEYGRKQN